MCTEYLIFFGQERLKIQYSHIYWGFKCIKHFFQFTHLCYLKHTPLIVRGNSVIWYSVIIQNNLKTSIIIFFKVWNQSKSFFPFASFKATLKLLLSVCSIVSCRIKFFFDKIRRPSHNNYREYIVTHTDLISSSFHVTFSENLTTLILR